MELNEFLKGFKDIKQKEKKAPVQLQFNLDLKLKSNLNQDKIGYKVKESNKYKKFGDE